MFCETEHDGLLKSDNFKEEMQMKRRNVTRNALFTSILALLMCVSMLVSTTFAWFTDEVVTGMNTIAAGNLDVELYANGEQVKADTPLFKLEDPNLWEPGVVVYENLQVANVGTLALQYQMSLNFGSENDLNGRKLSEVLKVAVIDKIAEGATRTEVLAAAKASAQVGSLADFSMTGELEAGKSSDEQTVVIFWEPNDNATDNLYNVNNGHETSDKQPLHIEFGVKLFANQNTVEKDSFDENYDESAVVPDGAAVVRSEDELIAALSGDQPVFVAEAFGITKAIEISVDAVISGNGATISRTEGYTGTVFSVGTGASLTLADITVDGGAVWAADGTNAGEIATGNLVSAGANAAIILGEGAILQNNAGAHAVNLGTRIGATLTLNGGEIVNNQSDSGAIWGGGHITINSGKINNNSSTGIGGAIRMVSNCNLTMNGGEISNNKAAGDGGAIWGYGASTYQFSGGEMNNNVSAGTGGAIYTGTYSTLNISGDFEMCNNAAANSGAIRLTDHTSMTMTGGVMSGNTQNGSSNAFNTWNNSISITGGTIDDDFSFVGGLGLTIGAAGIGGVIHYDLSTNHNTAYLASEFNEFSFAVDEVDANFANFNFKPAAGYIYTDCDEAKLVCLNEGYETYWDAVTSTFRLQAK